MSIEDVEAAHPVDDATRARQLLYAATTHGEAQRWERARFYADRAARLYERLAEPDIEAQAAKVIETTKGLAGGDA